MQLILCQLSLNKTVTSKKVGDKRISLKGLSQAKLGTIWTSEITMTTMEFSHWRVIITKESMEGAENPSFQKNVDRIIETLGNSPFCNSRWNNSEKVSIAAGITEWKLVREWIYTGQSHRLRHLTHYTDELAFTKEKINRDGELCRVHLHQMWR